MGPSPTTKETCSDNCAPYRRNSTIALLFHVLPFIITFSVVSIAVLHRLFPILCGTNSRHHTSDGRLRKRIAALTFSTTLGATGVLAELILCEVSEWVNGEARRLAFRVVVAVLLICLIVVIPLLEMHSFVEYLRLERRMQFLGVAVGFAGWLWVFWTLGDGLPIRTDEVMTVWTSSRTLSEECLVRVGVVGISLMALLSGFGAVSTPVHNFGTKPKPVTPTDISRSQAGLEAAHDLLATKRQHLSSLERRLSEKPNSTSIMSKVLSSVRPSTDTREHATLVSEIAGMETMVSSLSSDLSSLQRRLATQQRAQTPRGRVLGALYWAFSVYCLYRIFATTFAHLPHLPRSSSFSQIDPISNLLTLLAEHWDPQLDREAWSRQIGFCLSGVIIAGSLSSVLTTLTMLPSFLTTHSQNLALFVSQLSAVYVLASALLLRSNLPPHMSSVISESLGAPLDTRWVEGWFDGLFLGAVGTTAVSMIVVRKWSKEVESEIDVEGGKMC